MKRSGWNSPSQEKEMLKAFNEQSDKILSNPDLFKKEDGETRIGFESEVAIYGKIPQKKIEIVRNKIIGGELSEFTDKELGAAQIEFRTPPVDIGASSGFLKIKSIYENIFKRLLDASQRNGCSIIRSGTNPFLPVINSPRTNKPKYRQVPDYYNHHRRKDADTKIGLDNNKVEIGDAAVVSLFQSFQVNLQANSFEDAIDKMNRSLGIAPYLLALGANSRYLEYFDTKMQDVRLDSWEKSHDTGMQDIRLLSWQKSFDTGGISRVGLPERYFRDMQDYLARAGRFPFILNSPPDALKIAIGMTWLDSRIKFIDNNLVVELRLLPTQPTINEEMLLTLIYIGRLRYSEVMNERPLPIEKVRENRMSAMLYGMNRGMWFIAPRGPEWLQYKEGIRREIDKAKLGLNDIGLLRHFDRKLLESILANGTPSDRLAHELEKTSARNMRLKMETALRKTGMLIP